MATPKGIHNHFNGLVKNGYLSQAVAESERWVEVLEEIMSVASIEQRQLLDTVHAALTGARDNLLEIQNSKHRVVTNGAR